MITDIWEAERALWLNGAAEAALHIAPNCVMTLPEGVFQGSAIIDLLASAPRWQEASFSEKVVTESGQGRAITYRAVARRGASEVRRVQCASSWVRMDRWRLISHQQVLL